MLLVRDSPHFAVDGSNSQPFPLSEFRDRNSGPKKEKIPNALARPSKNVVCQLLRAASNEALHKI